VKQTICDIILYIENNGGGAEDLTVVVEVVDLFLFVMRVHDKYDRAVPCDVAPAPALEHCKSHRLLD